jgi:hypothetical protein
MLLDEAKSLEDALTHWGWSLVLYDAYFGKAVVTNVPINPLATTALYAKDIKMKTYRIDLRKLWVMLYVAQAQGLPSPPPEILIPLVLAD